MEKKILIVDDEFVNLEFFDVMLSRLGFQILKAENGEQALLRVREESPDLILLDNIMPILSGWEVTRTLKQDPAFEDWRHIPIIMFSAMHNVEDKVEGYELGIEDYIAKPFNFVEVLARIRAVLRSRDLSAQLLERERRIAVIESLNNSLIYFTQHLRQPVLDLLKASQTIDCHLPDMVRTFVDQVQTESETTLATLNGLEDEIGELQNQGDAIKEREVTVEMLDEKYRKRFEYTQQQRDGNDPQ